MTLTAAGPKHGKKRASVPVLKECDSAEQQREFFLEALRPVKTQLYNFIRKAMNFAPDADDVFQETLLKGFRYLHSFERERSFKTWIFTIAHNLVKDRFKGPSTHYDFPGPDMEQLASEQADADIIHEVEAVYRAAGQLKPRHRDVFFLYYYNEFTVMEIVGITGLSRANVKFILHRARNVIKKIVEVSS